MNNREIILHPKKIAKVLALAIEIQNKGIGTAFFAMHAHIAQIEVQVHLGSWNYDSEVDVRFTCDVHGEESSFKMDSLIKEMVDFINHHS